MASDRYSCHPSSSSSVHKPERCNNFNPTGNGLRNLLEEKNKNHAFTDEIIKECDIYNLNPDDLAVHYGFGVEGMWFFTQLNSKDEHGGRADRTAGNGFWRPTVGHKTVEHPGITKMNLNFYFGQKRNKENKSDWLMNEYKLEKDESPTVETGHWNRKRVAKTQDDLSKKMGEFILCKIYKRKDTTKKTNEAPIDPIHKKKKRVAKKTNEALVNEVFMEDQTNFIDYECPLATPGLQT